MLERVREEWMSYLMYISPDCSIRLLVLGMDLTPSASICFVSWTKVVLEKVYALFRSVSSYSLNCCAMTSKQISHKCPAKITIAKLKAELLTTNSKTYNKYTGFLLRKSFDVIIFGGANMIMKLGFSVASGRWKYSVVISEAFSQPTSKINQN